MIFTISALYCEPGIKFEISHKVSKLIMKKINEIMKVYDLDKLKDGTFLNLIVSTKEKSKKLQIMGPDNETRKNFISWGVDFPYRSIVDSENQLIPYIKNLFNAIIQILSEYNVNEEDIRNIQDVVEKEVIGNSEYNFSEQIIPPPDLSFLDL